MGTKNELTSSFDRLQQLHLAAASLTMRSALRGACTEYSSSGIPSRGGGKGSATRDYNCIWCGTGLTVSALGVAPDGLEDKAAEARRSRPEWPAGSAANTGTDCWEWA